MTAGSVNFAELSPKAHQLQHKRGLHVFPADHPGQPQCIGKHGPHSPCDGKRGKHPAVAFGTWAIAATSQMIDLEWSKHRGIANIAVACGPSQLVVLDEDEAGALDRWCDTNDITLPATYEVTTGRGRHVYFYWDHTARPIGNSDKAMHGLKINVRGNGGYAIAEGSVHESGAVYTGNGLPVAELPAQVAKLLLAGKNGSSVNGKGRPETVLTGAADFLASPNDQKIPTGKRHNALVAYAGRLLKCGLDYHEAEAVYRQRWLLCEQPQGQIPEARHHDAACQYPVTWEEAEAKLLDVFTRYEAGTGTESEQPAAPALADCEQDFWTNRESLKQIYAAAIARMCAPWAVLAHCAARALYTVSPSVTLPPLIGGPGSLNWFCNVVAPSGGGKSAAEDVAHELIPIPIEQRALGSGEGFIEAYQRPKEDHAEGFTTQYSAIVFVADESDGFSALTSRQGSTLLSTLRTAWTGKTISFGYRGRAAQKLAAHSYRTTLVVAVQPSQARWLLDDHGAGTPQRFMWFPGTDPRITAETRTSAAITPLSLPSWTKWQYGGNLAIPAEAERLIVHERAKAARGEQDALDGHALFCREKFAFALAVLDGRSEMTSEDWRLSGIAADVSARSRQWVAACIEARADEDAKRVGARQGVARVAAADVVVTHEVERGQRITRWVLKHLGAHGAATEGDMYRALASRDRPHLAAAIGALQAADSIVARDDGLWSKK
jgi:Bifunctional DNA primase/polymerase, N-terminal/Protein of unknown function (DUF3987)